MNDTIDNIFEDHDEDDGGTATNFTNGSISTMLAMTTMKSGHISLVEFLFNGVGVAVVSVLGLVGNILSILVFLRPRMKSATNILLIGLALSDATILTFLSLFRSKALIFDYFWGKSYADHLFLPVTPYMIFIIGVGKIASIYFTVVVSLDRFLAICFPFKSRAFSSFKKAKMVVVFIIVISIAFETFGFVRPLPRTSSSNSTTIGEETEKMTNKSSISFDTTCNIFWANSQVAQKADNNFETHYLRWPFLTFGIFIPFSLLAVLNSVIYYEVRKINQKRQIMTKERAAQISCATVCLMIVAIFFICHSVFVLMAIIERSSTCLWLQVKPTLRSIDTFLFSVNSAANFIIYCTMGTKFWRELQQLLINGWCCPGTLKSMQNGSTTQRQRHVSSVLSVVSQITMATTTTIDNDQDAPVTDDGILD